MRVRDVAVTLLGVAVAVITMGGCEPVHGHEPLETNGDLISLERLSTMGMDLEDGEVVEVLMSELDDSARAALLERNPALATDDFLNTVIHVDGGSDHLASRGSRVCRSSRYYIAHTPGCSGWVVTDKSKVNFYSDCPHRYYVMDNPGSVVEKRCKKAGCPYLYSRYIKYHKKV